MRRHYLFATVCLVIGLLVSASMAQAGPTVAIVKADNHQLVAETWKLDVLDFTKQWEAHWTKESEAAIERMVREAVKLAGGWPVKPGDTVAIVTNLVQDLWYVVSVGKAPNPEYANKFIQSMVVDARVVRALALMAKESGAKKVIIATGPNAGDAHAAYLTYGYTRMAREIGVELYDVNEGPWKTYKAPYGLALPNYTLPVPVVEADVRISVGPLKTHQLAGVTMTLKNWAIGIPPSRVYGAIKLGLPHPKMAKVVTDVHSIAKPDYAVISGIWGMEGNGPTMGEPVPMDLIIAGADPVAVDSVGAMVMGFNPDDFGTIRLPKEYGIGTNEGIRVVGRSIAEVAKKFQPPPENVRAPGAWAEVRGWK